MKLSKEFYKQIFESEPMAEHLARYSVPPRRIAEAVLLSPFSLIKKREILEELTKMPDGDEFYKYLAFTDRGIDGMSLKSGEILLLFEEFWGESKDFLAPCASWDDLWNRIKINDIDSAEDLEDEEPLLSYTAVKWRSDGKSFKKIAEYMIAGGEVLSFRLRKFDRPHGEYPMISLYDDLNLPTPFAPGDIVLTDCTPFAPQQRAVILECGFEPYECCLPCALYYDYNEDVWKTGAVKHKHIFPKGICSPLSPLYRIDYAPDFLMGESEETTEMLNKVSRYVNGSEEKARKLFNYIYDFICSEKGSRKVGITTGQLLDFLNRDE